VLGRGSNVLFDDGGFDGAVISMAGMNRVVFENGTVYAMAGAPMSEVAKCAKTNSIAGFEFLYGIPGSVGGGVYMNAGAYGGEMSQVIVSSTYYDTSDGTLHTITNSEHDYGYRKSVYISHPERIVVSAELRGTHGNMDDISARMSELMERRRTKQPLEFPSAGSVFKRCEGYFTGKLIEDAGLKGTSVGGAEISEKHAGFIVNKGGATAADVLALIDIIKSRIRETYGLELETEIIYVK
jgi:UDP-N-acetylmuramate dehydrogenase